MMRQLYGEVDSGQTNKKVSASAMQIYIYIYIYVCVCVCIKSFLKTFFSLLFL